MRTYTFTTKLIVKVEAGTPVEAIRAARHLLTDTAAALPTGVSLPRDEEEQIDFKFL